MQYLIFIRNNFKNTLRTFLGCFAENTRYIRTKPARIPKTRVLLIFMRVLVYYDVQLSFYLLFDIFGV